MDKVIIDGVDVSECPLFDKKTGCYHTFNGECVKDSCAVYKWLLEHKRLQAENERLKAALAIWENATLKQTALKVVEVDKYRQTLQEIRELIKKLDLSLGCAYGDYDCDNCSDINEETVCKIKLQNIILAKINEVIGAEE